MNINILMTFDILEIGNSRNSGVKKFEMFISLWSAELIVNIFKVNTASLI